jgi:hypothetical protein
VLASDGRVPGFAPTRSKNSAEAKYLASRNFREALSALGPGARSAGPEMTPDACVALARRELTAIAS